MSRTFPTLIAVCALVCVPFAAGCATCPDGRCGTPLEVSRFDHGACEYCGSDGIMPNGYPCQHCGPQLPNLIARFPFHRAFHNWLTCSTGCAEVYWDEWYNDPPRPDPCDSGVCRRRSCLANFWDTLKGDCCPPELDECCADDGEVVEYYDAPPTARLRRRAIEMPTDEEFTPAHVPLDDESPDLKAHHPRRMMRR